MKKIYKTIFPNIPSFVPITIILIIVGMYFLHLEWENDGGFCVNIIAGLITALVGMIIIEQVVIDRWKKVYGILAYESDDMLLKYFSYLLIQSGIDIVEEEQKVRDRISRNTTFTTYLIDKYIISDKSKLISVLRVKHLASLIKMTKELSDEINRYINLYAIAASNKINSYLIEIRFRLNDFISTFVFLNEKGKYFESNDSFNKNMPLILKQKIERLINILIQYNKEVNKYNLNWKVTLENERDEDILQSIDELRNSLLVAAESLKKN